MPRHPRPVLCHPVRGTSPAPCKCFASSGTLLAHKCSGTCLPGLLDVRASTGSLMQAGIPDAPCNAPIIPPTIAAFVSTSPPRFNMSLIAASNEELRCKCLHHANAISNASFTVQGHAVQIRLSRAMLIDITFSMEQYTDATAGRVQPESVQKSPLDPSSSRVHTRTIVQISCFLKPCHHLMTSLCICPFKGSLEGCLSA